jgi:hypothetical protein
MTPLWLASRTVTDCSEVDGVAGLRVEVHSFLADRGTLGGPDRRAASDLLAFLDFVYL